MGGGPKGTACPGSRVSVPTCGGEAGLTGTRASGRAGSLGSREGAPPPCAPAWSLLLPSQPLPPGAQLPFQAARGGQHSARR